MTRTIMKGNSPRVLLVVHGYPPRSHAGTENYTHSFARELADQGSTVGVFYPVSAQKSGTKPLNIKPFENHIVFEMNVEGKSLFNHLAHPSAPGVDYAFREVLRIFRPDVVHFQHTFVDLPSTIISLAKESDCFTCLTLHDFWFLCPHVYMLRENAFCGGPVPMARCVDCLTDTLNLNTSQTGVAGDRLLQFLEARLESTKSILSMVDLVTAPSRFVLNRFSQYVTLPQHMKIPLGLESPKVVRSSRPDGPLRFGFLGNITSLKNVHTLVEAFTHVKGDAQLHIYGEARGQEELANIIADLHKYDPRVIKHDAFTPNDLASILGCLDVGVVPSYFENYPLVLREFLSARMPVIASRVGGIPEIVTHGRNGLLIDPWDVHDLQCAMQMFVDKPELIDQMTKGMPQIKSIKQDVLVWSDIYNNSISKRQIYTA